MTRAAPKAVTAPAPPQPVEQKVTVRRGASVDIPLKIYGTRAQTLTWIIREPPMHGRLSSVRPTAAEAAVVTYQPAADVRFVADRFTFSVRSSEGVSAPVEVTIAIVDDAPQIGGVSELDFGTLLVGASAVRSLEILNSGGGIAEGSIEVNAPWKVEGARAYRLVAGERWRAKLVLAPEKAGKFEGEVRFTSQPDRMVALRGMAVDALAVMPEELLLALDAKRSMRVGSCEISNNTDTVMDVAIAASPRLVLEKNQRLGPHESVGLVVLAAESDATALEETIVFTAGKLSARLPVKAKALPAHIRARAMSVVFRKPEERAEERVVFENGGGLDAKVTLSVGAPFSVRESNFVLAAGAEKEIAILLGAGSAAGAQGILGVASEGGSFQIPVEVRRVTMPQIMPVAQKVSLPSNREKEPPEESAAFSADVFPAKVDTVTAHSATFHWKKSPSANVPLRCLERVLSLDESGELVTTFREYAACKYAPQGGTQTATVEKLQPGEAYFFQIEESRPEGPKMVAFAQIRTPSATPRKRIFSMLNVLIAFTLIAAGIILRKRLRPAGGL